MRKLTFSLLLSLFGCAQSGADFVSDGAETLRVAEGSLEAFGVLALVNDSGTTQRLLDDDVGLDVRAATSLIAHRDGADGVPGTADDDRFDDIAELDAQYYVGNSALTKLATYAAAEGYKPSGSDVVGTWDGVSFTGNEMVWTLELANAASHGELDDDIALNRRAADEIVAARPFNSLDGLASTYYVGGSALTRLRDHASAAQLGGPWDTCSTADDCAPGLVCMGELAWGSGIYCVDDSMYDNFTYDEATEIPDDGTELSMTMNVQGLATVPVDVVLTMDVEHARMSDLILSISNFNGYGETLWLHDANPEMEVVVRAFPSDDMVNGEYTVTIIDDVPGVEGTLYGWNLYIVSNWD